LGSILAVPICDDRGVVGVLQMNDDHKGRVSHEIVQIFECIAAHIGEALMRKRIEYDYHLLFRQMQEGVALHEIIRDDTGEIVDYRVLAVNPSYERLTGIAAAEAVGKTAREYTPITAQRWLQTFIHVVESGESAVIQDYFPRVRKHFRMVVFRPKLEQFAMVFTDISEQKRAEERLQESRREYASLLARMPGMVYRCGAGPEGAMEFVSDGCGGLPRPDRAGGPRGLSHAMGRGHSLAWGRRSGVRHHDAGWNRPARPRTR
jgi:PAS domain S-box-containing protein